LARGRGWTRCAALVSGAGRRGDHTFGDLILSGVGPGLLRRPIP
jgi:hypothetical protein